MKIEFISVGKKHDENLREVIEDYTNRIGHFCEVSWSIVKGRIENEKDKEKSLGEEGKDILEKIKIEDHVILLDETGKEWDTVELSKFLKGKQEESIKRLVFIIGGAFGISDEVRSRANHNWSLSKLTFPHMLVRLILSEQIYRATTILKGSKYHHS